MKDMNRFSRSFGKSHRGSTAEDATVCPPTDSSRGGKARSESLLDANSGIDEEEVRSVQEESSSLLFDPALLVDDFDRPGKFAGRNRRQSQNEDNDASAANPGPSPLVDLGSRQLPDEFWSAGADAIQKWMSKPQAASLDVPDWVREKARNSQDQFFNNPKKATESPSKHRADRIPTVQRGAVDAKNQSEKRNAPKQKKRYFWPGVVFLAGLALLLATVYFAGNVLGFGFGRYYAHFTVEAPAAKTVSVVGDFNGWDPSAHPLQRAPRSTVWETWVPVTPGRHRFAFLVDGRIHMIDPARSANFDQELQRGVSILIVPHGGGAPVLEGGKESAAVTRMLPAPRR